MIPFFKKYKLKSPFLLPIIYKNISGLVVLLIISSVSCQPISTKKINGLSFVATNDTVQQKHVSPVVAMNADWVSVMPFGFMGSLYSPQLYYNNDRQWYGETYDGIKQCIDLMHQNNIQVMLKPQIWIGSGAFTGKIQMKSEKDWRRFEEQYTNMMLLYAKLAASTDTEMICIGTEMNNFVLKRPDYWTSLIKKIRSVYRGKLTYAENWDTYKTVPFWSALDYIGIDAYFPISDNKTPAIAEVQNSWRPIRQNLQAFSESKDKQIIFTEFGYRSTDYAGRQPWDSSRTNAPANQQAQTNLLKAILESFWDAPWFAGGFLWKWFPDENQYKSRQRNRFSIQDKQAEEVVRNFYKK